MKMDEVNASKSKEVLIPKCYYSAVGQKSNVRRQNLS